MESKKLKKALNLGDKFIETKKKGIKYKLNLLFGMMVLLTLLVIETNIHFNLLDKPYLIESVASLVKIILSLAITFLGYRIVKDLQKWEETYKKVKEILT
ncbi:MAG: hypothetical protein ISS48_04395 [Candidatus Aenigmarchaeota archaeon]|nr:hypothetical protein [Candidatus Aenigmarchaeota archaeon]